MIMFHVHLQGYKATSVRVELRFVVFVFFEAYVPQFGCLNGSGEDEKIWMFPKIVVPPNHPF